MEGGSSDCSMNGHRKWDEDAGGGSGGVVLGGGTGTLCSRCGGSKIGRLIGRGLK